MAFKQTDLVRDFVFPLVSSSFENSEFKFIKLLGTAFLIGNQGYALTCQHIIDNSKDNSIAGCFVGEDTYWYGFQINEIEFHPFHDVALIKLNGGNWKSPFCLTSDKLWAWRDFYLCGYPDSVLYEDINNKDVLGNPLPRMDMVSIKGSIRRIIPRELNIKGIKGNRFYELSIIAGWGCSGSPLFEVKPNKSWEVSGIYNAQKIFYTENSFDDNIKYIDYNVGYAVTSECFYDWKPKILGKTVLEESQNYFT